MQFAHNVNVYASFIYEAPDLWQMHCYINKENV